MAIFFVYHSMYSLLFPYKHISFIVLNPSMDYVELTLNILAILSTTLFFVPNVSETSL